jgi:hypothetical protein
MTQIFSSVSFSYHFLSSFARKVGTAPRLTRSDVRRRAQSGGKRCAHSSTAMAVAELWETLKQTIVAYTGLSPAAFFTAVAVAAALYHVVSGLFAPPPPPPRSRQEPEAEPLPPPVQLGDVTEEELKQYDGSDPKKPLLMAIKGQIYDVTQSRSTPYP